MLKTAEQVSPKHPDKLCDQISDAVLDACLIQDPDSRVALETMGGHGIVTLTGEITTKAYVNIREIVQKIVPNIGVQTNIVQQSPFISQGVDIGGAGDQGIMIGYACNENEEMIPQELYLARKLCKKIYEIFPYDGKTQITLENGKVTRVVASFQNAPKEAILNLIENDYPDAELYINPAGDWNQGGFDADTGVTGRKLAVDSYGPQIPIGGGAFSGKDASKVDRSGAYMARRIAVDFLKKKSAKEVYMKLAYAIGKKEPLQAIVITDGIEEEIQGYDLTPKGIIDYLDLKKPIFQKTAEWGHFGNNFRWDN